MLCKKCGRQADGIGVVMVKDNQGNIKYKLCAECAANNFTNYIKRKLSRAKKVAWSFALPNPGMRQEDSEFGLWR